MAGKLLHIFEDVEHYNKAYVVWNKLGDKIALEKQWCKEEFDEGVLPLLDVKLDDGEDFCALGIGSGPGEVETHILRKLLRKFPRINNNVVDPSEELMTKYKTRVSENKSDLKGIDYHWHQMIFEDYKEKRKEEGDDRRFHFISALHSLYYFDDLGKWLDYMYGLLAEGGVLLVIMGAETNGYANIHREFPNLGRIGTSASSNVDTGQVRNHFDKNDITFSHGTIPVRVNITSCLDDNPSDQGDLVLDYLAHCKDFRKNTDDKFLKRFIEFLTSDKCTEKKGDNVFLKSDCGFVVAQKKKSI